MDWILALSILAGQLIKIPFGLGGINLLDLTILLLSCFGLYKLKFKLRVPPLFIIAGQIFLVICIFSLLLTPLHLTSFEYLQSFSYTLRWALYLFLGWLSFSSLRLNPFNILGTSGVVIAALGVIQFLFIPDLSFLAVSGWDPHFYRTASTFLDPNFLGAFLVLTLLLLLNKMQINTRNFIIFAIVYFALLTTFSRSSYLMFLTSFLTFSFIKKSIRSALLTITLFSLLLFSFQIYIQAVNKTTPLDRGQTASYRLTTWQQGFTIFQKNPLTGVGFNAYNFALKEYRIADQQFLAGKGATTNDSSLLYVLSTTGIVGFLAFLFFLYGLIKLKNIILTSAVFGLLAHSIFVNSLFYPYIIIWIILVASKSNDNQLNKQP